MQYHQPEQWQRTVLASRSMVSVPPHLGMPAAYVVGTGQLVKTVLAGEGDITLQGIGNPGFGKKNDLVMHRPSSNYCN